ncbi:hypothetical protein [Burkholderia phage BCSR5]|nr:hypothetical protein [Burkholderia phage BCSR5]
MRNFQLTDAGVAMIKAATGPVICDTAKLGSGVNYVPQASDTDIHGLLVWTAPVAPPAIINANIIRYTVALDYDLGDFDFGEVGLFVGPTLFALGSNNVYFHKYKIDSPNGTGNAMRIDIYLSMVGLNYDMWGDLAESNNPFRVAVLESVDYLPMSKDATPNMYAVQGASSDQSAFLAYTDRQGLWQFDAYAYANTLGANIINATNKSITLKLSDFKEDLRPLYYGMLIAEFAAGPIATTCRNIESVVISGGVVVMNFRTPLAMLPNIGDPVIFFNRQALSVSSVILPIATKTKLGGVIVGDGLDITPSGVLSINKMAFPVTSVNDMTGDVHIDASNLPGLARVAQTGSYKDLKDKPPTYTLPVATQTRLGGVKAPQTLNHLAIAGDGTIDLTFEPVKSVNGVFPDPNDGNVVIAVPGVPTGLTNAKAMAAGDDLNTYTTVGLYFAVDQVGPTIKNLPETGMPSSWTLEVVPLYPDQGSGDVIQRIMTAVKMYWRRLTGTQWSAWIQFNPAPPVVVYASKTQAGIMQVGDGLNVTGNGLVSTQIQSVNGHKDQDIVLTADDVQAIPAPEKDQEGGVASLTARNPDDPTQADDEYTFGRVPFRELPFGAWNYTNYWDAAQNIIGDPFPPPDPSDPTSPAIANRAMHSNGRADVDTKLGVQRNVLVTGNTYLVTVAGGTPLDGINDWQVGDIAVSLNGKWHRIITDFTNTVFSAGTF